MPIVAVVWLWSRYSWRARGWAAVSMAASFVFGLVFHFIVPGVDNVFTLAAASWRITLKTERVTEASPNTQTILRATQFYDFVLSAVLQVAEVNREQ